MSMKKDDADALEAFIFVVMLVVGLFTFTECSDHFHSKEMSLFLQERTPGPGFRFVCKDIDVEKFLAAGWKIQPGVAQGSCPGMTIEGPALK
jgi:hypothetical protein